MRCEAEMRIEVSKYEGFLIFASFVWGTSFVATKIGVEHVDPYYFTLLRFGIGAIVLLVATIIFGGFKLDILRDKMVWGIGLLNAIGQTLQNVGMTQTTATNAVLLVDINVVFIAILASVILREKLTSGVRYGLVIGLIGVAIVATEGDMSQILSGSFVGNLTVFVAGIVWSFYVVYQKKTLMRLPQVLMLTTGVILASAVFCLPSMLLLGHSSAIDLSGTSAALYTGILCTGLAYLLYIAGLRGVGATASSVILLLEIVFAMIFAILVLSEIPTVATAIGALLIVASIMVTSTRENGKRRTDKNLT
jgi:drug/metabolite transporter (DMT)-like permease